MNLAGERENMRVSLEVYRKDAILREVIEPSALKKVAGCVIRKTASGKKKERKGRKSPILNFFQTTFFLLSSFSTDTTSKEKVFLERRTKISLELIFSTFFLLFQVRLFQSAALFINLTSGDVISPYLRSTHGWGNIVRD